ncbi:ATP-binding protein [Accumulibacter sp.]|uniref:sensor histidine kinase n=1 Tax=Accumulibacter sp. TaxID=2053492 RepID=UPI0035B05429
MLIRSQLRIAALLPALLAVLVGGVLWASWNEIARIREGADVAEQLGREVSNMNIVTQEYLLGGSSGASTELRRQQISLSSVLAGAHFSEPEGEQLLETLRQDHEDNVRLLHLLFEAHPSAREQVIGALLVNLQGLGFKAQQLADLQRAAMARVRGAANTRIIAVLVTVSLLSVLFLSLLSRRLNRGFEVLLEGLRRAAGGDLEQAIRVADDNEFGTLSRSFNAMAEQLKKVESERAMATEELKLLNAVLEGKVVERTAKLEAAHQALEQSQAQMLQMEKLSALGTLVGGVAHEVNNPLMGILGYLEYAIGKLEEGRPRSMLERAVGEVERIARIVKNMLVFSRMPLSVADQNCDPARVLADTLVLLEGERRQADVLVDLRLPAPVPRLRCSHDALQQVLLNLLFNACHACKESPGPHSVRVTLEQFDNARAVLRVADNGPGVPDAIKARIFDPFFTTREAGSGTGLGLAVSRQLIDNAGGKLTLADMPGGGAVFSIELDVLPEEA